jgi:hypothetical protein
MYVVNRGRARLVAGGLLGALVAVVGVILVVQGLTAEGLDWFLAPLGFFLSFIGFLTLGTVTGLLPRLVRSLGVELKPEFAEFENRRQQMLRRSDTAEPS